MRKVVFQNIDEKTKKLMLCQAKGGVYLFGYYSLQDSSADWDHFFCTMEDAIESCFEEYGINEEDWIIIVDQPKNCQQDFIIPTRIKGREVGKPVFGQLQQFIKGQWVDYEMPEKCISFDGLTGDQRLLTTGLVFEYEKALIEDKGKATKILKALNFDKLSTDQIIA
jgi:biofilm protein TabA